MDETQQAADAVALEQARRAASEARAVRLTRVLVVATVVVTSAAVGWMLDWRSVKDTAVDQAKAGVVKTLGGHFHADEYHGIPERECRCLLRNYTASEAY